MGQFCQHRAVKVIAEFDDAWAEELKKKSNFQNTDFLEFFIKPRQSIKKVLYQKKIWVTEHLRELNPFIDIKMPTCAVYLYISSTALALHARRGMTTLPELRAQ